MNTSPHDATMAADDYTLSLLIATHIGATWGRCYQNAYPAFFAFPSLFQSQGVFVEGWTVFEDQGHVVLMEHGWLMSGTHTIDPTIVLGLPWGTPLFYFPGVLRGHDELLALENELFPHVRFSAYGADGMGHPEYQAAYQAARRKAETLVADGKPLLEVRAKTLTAEEEKMLAASSGPTGIVVLSLQQKGRTHGQKRK